MFPRLPAQTAMIQDTTLTGASIFRVRVKKGYMVVVCRWHGLRTQEGP